MKEVNNDTSSEMVSKKVLNKNDILIPFALVLLMLSFSELTVNMAGVGILVLLISDLISLEPEGVLTILNLGINLIGQIGAILIFLFLFKSNKVEPDDKAKLDTSYLNFKSKPLFQVYILYSMELAILTFVLFFIDPLLAPLGESASSYEAILPSGELLGMPLYYILFFGVLIFGAAISEELIFRRTLIPLLERRGLGTFWALLFSTLMFSLIHVPADLVEYFNSNSGGAIRFAINHFFGTFAGGLTLGYIYMRTRDIRWPMIAHGFSNGFSGLVILGEAKLEEMMVSMGLTLEELLNSILEGSIALSSDELIAFNIVQWGSIWMMISIIIGFCTLVYAGFEFIKFKNSDKSIKPVWVRIVTDVNRRIPIFNIFILGLLLFISIEGGKSLFIFILSPYLGPESQERALLVYLIEILMLTILVIILFIFIFRIGKSLDKPDYISPLTYSVEPVYTTPIFYSTDSTMTSQAFTQFCGSCGKPLIQNALYCGYCGSKAEFRESLSNEKEKID
ncbi:MAG: type II CAAX prenyl endopeptidase Rce1 family protein [Candidatus Hodarchaeota archaeon]